MPYFTAAFAYLVMSTLFIQVGPFISINGHSLYKGTQLLLVEPLIWVEDMASMFSKRYGSGKDADAATATQRHPSDARPACGVPTAGVPALVPRVKQRYAVIFDGGSTGTRVQVFVFNKTRDTAGRAVLTLSKDHFKQVKPGLSAYAHEPSEAAASLQPLLQLVTHVVPEGDLSDRRVTVAVIYTCPISNIELRSKTPLLLRATAGLRLLNADAADRILAEVYSHLSGFGFKMTTDSVSILDGSDEGTYAWITVNFLLNRLSNPKASVAVLDLGGGSTQIAFTPSSDETLQASSEKIVEKKIYGQNQQLYTHSYLGYGLMSARKALLTYSIEGEF